MVEPTPAPGEGALFLSVQDVLDAAPDAMVVADGRGRIVAVNRQTEELFGYAPGELVGQPVEVLLPEDLRRRHRQHRATYAAHPATRAMGSGLELTAVRRDGTALPVEISLAPLTTAPEPLVVAAVRDVSARHEAEQALRASEERFRLTVDASPLGIALVSLDGHWLRVNDALCELVGSTRDELLATTFADLLGDEGDLQLEVHPSGRAAQWERSFVNADGETMWTELTMSLVRTADGQPLHFVAQFRDITESRRRTDDLQRLALTDPLTGLPNRTLLLDRTARLLGGLSRQPGSVTLQLLDLDHFKDVNDAFGHQAGDVLLQEVSHRLRKLARTTDTVARLGGDEFALLGSGSPDQAERLAARVLQALSRPVTLTSAQGDLEVVTISASIGIATSSSSGSAPQDLYRQADLALYKAKADGRARTAVYDDSLLRPLRSRIS